MKQTAELLGREQDALREASYEMDSLEDGLSDYLNEEEDEISN